MVSGALYSPGFSLSRPVDNNNSSDNQAHHRIIANSVGGFRDNPNSSIYGGGRLGNSIHPTVASAESGFTTPGGGGDLTTALYGGDCHRGGNAMSSYLPLRHSGAHGVPTTPRGPVGAEDNVMHGMGGMMDSGGYMEHFLNIPEICPTGNYRNPRYYMGAYNAEACRMEALQQQHRNHHDLRMGLQGSRPSFYPNMNMGMRFGDGMDSAQVASNCIPQQNRADNLSPCTKAVAVPTESDAPSFYPWMSIVGEYQSVLP
uniref:Uncharacterized protein n=1 Tax=Biomphalaria glabrata TaxID=6526 RepID=A0A2C9LN42_BIOGL